MKTFLKTLILAATAFQMNSIMALEVTAKTLEIEVTVKAKNYGDNHDSTNEYKLDLRLQDKTGHFKGYAGSLLGVLKGSHSKNAWAPFSSYERIKMEESLTRKAIVHLPESVLEDTQVRLILLEADFSIPIPGPCCIIANDDDYDLSDKIDLALGAQELSFTTETAEVTVKVKDLGSKQEELDQVLRTQAENLFDGSDILLNRNDEFSLYRHVVENI